MFTGSLRGILRSSVPCAYGLVSFLLSGFFTVGFTSLSTGSGSGIGALGGGGGGGGGANGGGGGGEPPPIHSKFLPP